MALHLATTAAISWSIGAPKPVVGAPVFNLRPVFAKAAVSFTTTAMPMAAHADEDGGLVDFVVNAGLTVLVLGFVAFIGSVR